MSIIDKINDKSSWNDFYNYKIINNGFTKNEEMEVRNFIDEEKFNYYYRLIIDKKFPQSFPRKMIINKEGTTKKRIVYSYDKDENIILKFIAYNLYDFDKYFTDNCYAFRRNYGVKDAINRLKRNTDYGNMYCYKADISNYFNSIDVDRLLYKLEFVKKEDELLYELFKKLLKEERVIENGKNIAERHGAMAGTPCSPFFANVYLMDVDRYFKEQDIKYFRYSDDILFFCQNENELKKYINIFLAKIEENLLVINEEKVSLTKPEETFDFLGFSYSKGVIDLSANTKRKMKARIKRKAEALRRWQRKKELSKRAAAVGFINAMNRKFYGKNTGKAEKYRIMEDKDVFVPEGIKKTEFTWCRWFLPNITTDKSLREIDEYMQQYIRYVITGRHYKGNYRITYEQLKEMGYRSLVHEYYSRKNK